MTVTNIKEAQEAFAKLHELWQGLNRSVRLLLVEDDMNDVRLINHVVGDFKVRLRIAITGSEAKQWLMEEDYDIVLLDLKLPDMSGVELIQWAKGRNAALPFVVLTGMSDASPLIKDSLLAGAECVIQKPLTPDNAKMILGTVR